MTTYKKVGRQRMSDAKKYPTRMHEVLGVETGEIFTINEDDYGFYHTLDRDGQIVFADPEDEKEYRVTADMVTSAINHGITRRPRLTEEQVRRLKALYDYGMRWMFFSHPTARDPWLYATTNKPSYTEPDWDGQGGWSWDGERLRIKGSPLNELERVCADSPLDIVQTLRDAGVEVE